MKICNALKQDMESVYELSKKMATSFKVEHKSFKRSFLINLKNCDSIILVAKIDNKIIGYLLGFDHYAFYANGRVSWVEEVFVEDNCRKKGIGKKLMQCFENWAKQRGSKLIGLATRRASGFYKAIGYNRSATFFIKKF
jgi:GNAT superfamily N-acetyltransferase